MDYLEKIASYIFEGNHLDIGNLIDTALKDEIPVKEIVEKGMVAGIEHLGRKWDEGTVYLPEVFRSVRAAKAGFETLQPALAKSDMVAKGKVVIGTIEGDMHDIGKNLVKLVLEADGFHVVDLGVDVTPAKFRQTVAEEKADIVAISALLTTTVPGISQVIETLKESGLRSGVKVIVGGAPLNEKSAREIGADAYGKDCFQAIDIANDLVKGSR